MAVNGVQGPAWAGMVEVSSLSCLFLFVEGFLDHLDHLLIE